MDDTESPKRASMACPACSRALGFVDLRRGRCWWCETRICIPKAYYRSISVTATVVTIVFIVMTFSTFFTSPASFPLVMLWLLLIYVVFFCSLWLGVFVSFRVFPPVVERLYANDVITRLRLDD